MALPQPIATLELTGYQILGDNKYVMFRAVVLGAEGSDVFAAYKKYNILNKPFDILDDKKREAQLKRVGFQEFIYEKSNEFPGKLLASVRVDYKFGQKSMPVYFVDIYDPSFLETVRKKWGDADLIKQEPEEKKKPPTLVRR